jgi:hypothetical protein
MKYGQKLKLGDAHVTPKNIQEIQASKYEDAPRHHFFIGAWSDRIWPEASGLPIDFRRLRPA